MDTYLGKYLSWVPLLAPHYRLHLVRIDPAKYYSGVVQYQSSPSSHGTRL